MAANNYLVYRVGINGNGEQESTLKLYRVDGSSRTLVFERTGVNGVDLRANLVNNVYQPNKRNWIDTFAASGNDPSVVVNVLNAGTENAAIWFIYDNQNYMFDASDFEFEVSGANSEYMDYNPDSEDSSAGTEAAYQNSLTSAAGTSAVSCSVSGTIDPLAETNVLRYGTDPGMSEYREITLPRGTSEEIFPVIVTGLESSTTYYFQLVSSGALGSVSSSIVSAATTNSVTLGTPTFDVCNTDYDSVKRLRIGNVANAVAFDIEYGLSETFEDGSLTARVRNNNGAEFYARDLQAEETYYFRVKAVPGDGQYADSDWSEVQESEIGAGEDVPSETAELRIRSNVYLDAEPTQEKHVATVGKVYELFSELGTLVHSVAGYSDEVTSAQILAGFAADSKLIVHGAQNVNNIPQITASSTDDQIASAKAIYHLVDGVRSDLSLRLSDHSHNYLYAQNGESVLASPDLSDDAAIVPDCALGSYFDASVIYRPGAVVVEDGFLYQNTSGENAQGNRDFLMKFEKKTLVEILNGAGGSGGNRGRFEMDFTGADLNEQFEIDVPHGLGEQFVVVQVVDTTDGMNNAVTGVQVNLSGANALKLSFSNSVTQYDSFKVIVLA